MFYLFTSLTLLPYYHSHPFTILTIYLSYLLPLLPYYLFIPCSVVYFVSQIIAT